jgi:hypothetical protein
MIAELSEIVQSLKTGDLEWQCPPRILSLNRLDYRRRVLVNPEFPGTAVEQNLPDGDDADDEIDPRRLNRLERSSWDSPLVVEKDPHYNVGAEKQSLRFQT